MKIVKVTWYDAYSIDRWQGKDQTLLDTEKPMECETTGYLLQKNKGSVTICHTFNAEGSVCGTMQIPIKCLIKPIEIIQDNA